ncbi:MAG: FeoA family protein [Acidimicrobiia bacterium]
MADNTTNIVTLADVAIGGSAVIRDFEEGARARRFVEMGFVPGTTVTVLRSAPLGDPIEYAVMGGRIAMRRSDASVILVEVSF